MKLGGCFDKNFGTTIYMNIFLCPNQVSVKNLKSDDLPDITFSDAKFNELKILLLQLWQPLTVADMI